MSKNRFDGMGFDGGGILGGAGIRIKNNEIIFSCCQFKNATISIDENVSEFIFMYCGFENCQIEDKSSTGAFDKAYAKNCKINSRSMIIMD